MKCESCGKHFLVQSWLRSISRLTMSTGQVIIGSTPCNCLIRKDSTPSKCWIGKESTPCKCWIGKDSTPCKCWIGKDSTPCKCWIRKDSTPCKCGGWAPHPVNWFRSRASHPTWVITPMHCTVENNNQNLSFGY